MLALALMLAAAPEYVDPYADEKELREEPVRTAPPEVTSAPQPGPSRDYSQTGFTGSVGAVVPLENRGELGVHGGLGMRYGMRPPNSDSRPYFTPAISVRLAGQFVSTTRGEGPRTDPLGGQPPLTTPTPKTFGDVGVDVRLELTVSRRGGMLMPDFATWLSTGTALGFDGQRVFPTAHVGFGLGINFVRDVGPALAKALFSPDSWKGLGGTGGGSFNLGGLGGGGGWGIVAVLAAIVIIPIIVVAGMCAVFLGGSLTSMANVELRYTMFPSDKGVGGYGGLVIGFGI
jgi:hypothetical protein